MILGITFGVVALWFAILEWRDLGRLGLRRSMWFSFCWTFLMLISSATVLGWVIERLLLIFLRGE